MKPIPFDEGLERDWPGAEAWPDGKPPLYQSGTFTNGETYELILDKNGAHLYPERAQRSILHLLRNFKSQEDALAFAGTLNMPKTDTDFVRAGFVPDRARTSIR